MKISDVKDITAVMVQQYQRSDNQAAGAEKPNNNTAGKPEEKVDLSTQAKEIQQARIALSRLPDVREEKVQEIRSQVEKGTYEVNEEKIAGKMVGESIVDIFA